VPAANETIDLAANRVARLWAGAIARTGSRNRRECQRAGEAGAANAAIETASGWSEVRAANYSNPTFFSKTMNRGSDLISSNAGSYLM